MPHFHDTRPFLASLVSRARNSVRFLVVAVPFRGDRLPRRRARMGRPRAREAWACRRCRRAERFWRVEQRWHFFEQGGDLVRRRRHRRAGQRGGPAAGSGGSSVSGTVPVRQPLPCFASAGTPAEGDLVVELDANRLSGVAPRGVLRYAGHHGDHSPTSRSLDSAYCWDFSTRSAARFPRQGLRAIRPTVRASASFRSGRHLLCRGERSRPDGRVRAGPSTSPWTSTRCTRALRPFASPLAATSTAARKAQLSKRFLGLWPRGRSRPDRSATVGSAAAIPSPVMWGYAERAGSRYDWCLRGGRSTPDRAQHPRHRRFRASFNFSAWRVADPTPEDSRLTSRSSRSMVAPSISSPARPCLGRWPGHRRGAQHHRRFERGRVPRPRRDRRPVHPGLRVRERRRRRRSDARVHRSPSVGHARRHLA